MKFTTLIGLVGLTYANENTDELANTDLAEQETEEPSTANPEAELAEEQPEADNEEESQWEDLAETEEQPEAEPTSDALAQQEDQETEEQEPADDENLAEV